MFRIIMPHPIVYNSASPHGNPEVTVECETEDEFVVAATHLQLTPPIEYHVDSNLGTRLTDLIDNINPAPTPFTDFIGSGAEAQHNSQALSESEHPDDANRYFSSGNQQRNDCPANMPPFVWNNMSEQQKQEHLMLKQKQQIEHEPDSKGPFQRAVERLGKPVGLVPPKQPNAQEVICPNCTHQFRAIPVQVQDLLKAAGYEPPFTDQIDPVVQAYQQQDALEADRAIAELQATNGDLRQKVQHLIGVKDSLEAHNNQLGQVLIEHQQKIELLENALKVRIEDLDRLQNDNMALLESGRDLDKRCGVLTEQAKLRGDTIDELKKERESLNARLDTQSNTIFTLINQRGEDRTAIHNLEERLASKTEEAERLRTANQNLFKAHQEATNKLSQLLMPPSHSNLPSPTAT